MRYATGRDSQTRSQRRLIPELNMAQWEDYVPVGDPALWMYEALADVNRFDSLQPGWDGGTSHRPGSEVLELARRIVIAAAHVENVPAPHIGPVPGGGVQLEWHTGARDLELELLPSGPLTYMRTQGDLEEDGVFSVERVEKATELVEWLTQ